MFNIRCVTRILIWMYRTYSGDFREKPSAIQGADSDSDASDYEGDEVDLDVVMRELGEYMFANHPYANIYDFDFQ